MNEDCKELPNRKLGTSQDRMTQHLPIIDLSYLLKIGSQDPVFISEMLSLFKKQSLYFLKTSKAQLIARMYVELAQNAHSFKPQGAYLGVEELKVLIGELEMEARTNQSAHRMEMLLSKAEKLIFLMVAEIETRYQK
jgi:HPt (histidine-containing phosphotransfer) domain-containing protein